MTEIYVSFAATLETEADLKSNNTHEERHDGSSSNYVACSPIPPGIKGAALEFLGDPGRCRIRHPIYYD